MTRRGRGRGIPLALLLAACTRAQPAVATPVATATLTASPSPPPATATATETSTAAPPASPSPAPAPTVTPNTLATLLNTVVPPRDLLEIARQLKGLDDIPAVVNSTPPIRAVGDTLTFWAGNVDTNEKFQLEARLAYATDHLYFFVDEVIAPDFDAVRDVAEIFEAQIYPTTRAFFGSEWTPGVDGDPHLYILYARGLGFRVAGYYSSADQYPRAAYEFSNEKEMFYINADTVPLRAESIVSVLAHEFQHMIHWANDSNEESWLNEGAAELARLLNGYGVSGFARAYLANPDLQLNSWALPNENSAAHYGAGFLFLTYFLGRFGRAATQALVADPANGLQAVDSTLAALGAADSQSGQPLTSADLFADWVVANYLRDGSIADGRYTYSEFEDIPRISGPSQLVSVCPTGPQAHTVSQFGVDYIEVRCVGAYTLVFSGRPAVALMPTDPHSGDYMFWGNRQDNSVARLQRVFDLTAVEQATLEFWTWFAIEEDYDYAYVEVSTDGGRRWSILETPNGTGDNPTGNNIQWGYNGFSGGASPAVWLQERVDLTPFAGQEVMVRFEYVTDDATNREGFLLDDVSVPEIGYLEDFESGAEGWQAEGFVRVANVLPQTFIVQLIRQRESGATVERLALDASLAGEVVLELGVGESAVVVVAGTTPFTTEPAEYRLEVR